MIHESREVTVRETRKPGQDSSIEKKVLKKRVDEFGEAGGMIGIEEKTFMKIQDQLDNNFLQYAGQP